MAKTKAKGGRGAAKAANAEANAAKYGNPGGGFSSSGLESLKNELAALQAAQ